MRVDFLDLTIVLEKMGGWVPVTASGSASMVTEKEVLILTIIAGLAASIRSILSNRIKNFSIVKRFLTSPL